MGRLAHFQLAPGRAATQLLLPERQVERRLVPVAIPGRVFLTTKQYAHFLAFPWALGSAARLSDLFVVAEGDWQGLGQGELFEPPHLGSDSLCLAPLEVALKPPHH